MLATRRAAEVSSRSARQELARRRVDGQRARAYAHAQNELRDAFARIRIVGLVTLGLAWLALLAGQIWMLMREKPKPAGEGVPGLIKPKDPGAEALERERERRVARIEGTYPLGLALVALLWVPLLPPVKAEDINPQDPPRRLYSP